MTVQSPISPAAAGTMPDAPIFDPTAFRLADEQAAIIATARNLGQTARLYIRPVINALPRVLWEVMFFRPLTGKTARRTRTIGMLWFGFNVVVATF